MSAFDVADGKLVWQKLAPPVNPIYGAAVSLAQSFERCETAGEVSDAEMGDAERNQPVQTLPTHRADQSLTECVGLRNLPGVF